MSYSPYEIHEFSTGIQVEQRGTDWVSKRFTGHYMNSTLERIPKNVEQAIADKLFAVVEGSSGNKPAIVGRVVPSGFGESAWAVLAIATRGQDDHGRGATLYRYFLNQSENGLDVILTWIRDVKNPNQPNPREWTIPLFDPYDYKYPGHPNSASSSIQTFDLKSDLLHQLNQQNSPIIIQPNEHNVLVINTMARQKAANDPIAWAFDVEALERPETFQIIRAATQPAYKRLNEWAIHVFKPLPVILGQQALKTKINSLINDSLNRADAVQAFEEALGDKAITKQHWEIIFEQARIDSALEGTFLGESAIRLLTLWAIAIPTNLPEYLQWLVLQKKEYFSFSANFQRQIISLGIAPSNLRKKAGKGIEHTLFVASSKQLSLSRRQRNIPETLSKLIQINSKQSDNIYEALSKLIKINHGFWELGFKVFTEALHNVLSSRVNESSGSPYELDSDWIQIVEKLINHHQFNTTKGNSRSVESQRYKDLAVFFFRSKVNGIPSNQLRNIAYVFAQSGYGKVPRKITLREDFGASREQEFYGLTVKRELDLIETAQLKDISRINYAAGNIIFFLLGVLSTLLFIDILKLPLSPVTSNPSQDNPISPKPISPANVNCLSDFQNPIVPPNMSAELQQNAEIKFSQTAKEIRSIVNKVQMDLESTGTLVDNSTIISKLRSVLSDPNLQYSCVIASSVQDSSDQIAMQSYDKERVRWIVAIYTFQEDNFGRGYGYLEPDSNHSKTLSDEIKNQFGPDN